MTPNDIEILIHCHVSPAQHPRYGSPAVGQSLHTLEKNGLIERYAEDKGSYITTDRGRAHVNVLCLTPWPKQRWVDQNEKIIEI